MPLNRPILRTRRSAATAPKAFGQKGEEAAARHLKKKGYKILTQNYRTRFGEIDIIAKEKDTLVFVEVKARRTRGYGSPKLAITDQKKRKISMVALCYLKATSQTEAKARFDVVTLSPGTEKTRFEIVQNAFELAYP